VRHQEIEDALEEIMDILNENQFNFKEAMTLYGSLALQLMGNRPELKDTAKKLLIESVKAAYKTLEEYDFESK
jgi:hypothetical protein